MSDTFDKNALLDSFIEEVNSYLPEIETNLQRLAQSPGDMDALEEAYRRTHTIGGSASMMDFPGLAHVAHGMEDILGDALEGIAPLDAPTIGLLQRSLGRLRRLLDGIRTGAKADAIVAEDDADYEQYRQQINLSATPAQKSPAPVSAEVQKNTAKPVQQETAFASPYEQVPPSPALPSFDEVLASFQAPAVNSARDLAWPEEAESATSSHHVQSATVERTASPMSPVPSARAMPPVSPLPATQFQVQEGQKPQSALDELVASTRKTPTVTPPTPVLPATNAFSNPPVTHSAGISPLANASIAPAPATPPAPLAETKAAHVPDVYTRMQEETQSLEKLMASFKQLVTQLRAAITVIEGQRSEFKGFLDGSKDALERMEDWAGRAMNLNLRNSPEQVRRFLPLSVMWVSNRKLKKVQDVLKQIADSAQANDDQFEILIQQLQNSLKSSFEAFRQMQEQVVPILKQEPGWSAWEMQEERSFHDTGAVRERVTFERQGDLAALRAEVEAQVRNELRREYEARYLTSAERVALEQQIRDEVRREFEARQQSQQARAGYAPSETLQELEARLRSEIEIQVRQEVLASLTTNSANNGTAVDATGAVSPSTTSASQTEAVLRTTVGTQSASSSARPMVQSLPTAGAASDPSSDFGEEAVEIFRLEAEEHLQSISMNVAELEKSPTNREFIQGIRRATHTLKGAAGMMGFRLIADLCHVSEDLLDCIMEGTTTISPAVLSIILDTAETLDTLITGKGTSPVADAMKVQALRTRYAQLLGTQGPEPDQTQTEAELVAEGDATAEAQLAANLLFEEENETQRTAPGDLSVRVRLQKLDELINLFGELLVNRAVLEERIQRLAHIVADVELSSTRLYDVGQKLESNFEAATLPSGHSVQVMPGEGERQRNTHLNGNGRNGQEPAHLAEFDELELDRYTEFHRLARGLSEGISDVTTLSAEMEAVIRECENVFSRETRLSTTFQDRLMKVRLVPLSAMKPRLYRAARSVALKQHKEFEFVMEGEETEVDRTVYEEIAGPLLHLMRNAVNHAIETPEVRMQKGKSPAGRITLSASYEGNEIVITVRDDGTGIDPEHVRNSAIARGLIQPDQALSQNDLIELIFRPGFSTAEVLSEESGRGVGLDVVRDSVSRLRGTIEVESTPGQGTAFTMRFPTSMAIQSAMMIGVGGQQFAIPTALVVSISRLDTFKRSTKNGQPAISVRNELYPLHMLAQYLSLPVGQIDERAQVVLVNAAGQHVALIVDEIKGKMDVVMKSLGPHLRHVHGVLGGTVLGNGQVVLILDLGELLSSRTRTISAPPRREEPPQARHVVPPAPPARAVPTPAVAVASVPVRQAVGQVSDRRNALPSPTYGATAPVSTSERGKYVLVVDDSPSVRRVVSSLLKQHGWEVQMARDGVEALEIITNETPAAVLLDIEMPRMDGYELIATVRAQEQYRTLPMIVLTSRAAAKHQQRAVQLGASDYVVKPYQDEELLSKLNALVFGTAVG